MGLAPWTILSLNFNKMIEAVNLNKVFHTEEGTTVVMVIHSMHDSEFAHRKINLFDRQVIT